MYIDQALLGALGTLFTVLTGALGWLVKTLWADRDAATDKLVEMLKLQFTGAAERKDIWDKLTQAVTDQSRSVDELRRSIDDLKRRSA